MPLLKPNLRKGRGVLSSLVTFYLFLGGAGGGALLIMCGLELLERFPLDAPRDYLTHRQLQGRSSLLCFAFLALGAICLWADLGRSSNIIALLVSPKLTPLTVGAFSLVLSLLCAAFLVLEKNFELRFPSLLRLALHVAGLICGLLVIGYTGVLLGSSPAVVAWRSPLVLVLFVLSSLSSGFALLFVASAFTDRAPSSAHLLNAFMSMDTVIVALEAAALAAFVLLAMGEPASESGARALVQGELAPLFWAVLVAVGLIVPFMLERSPLRLEAGYLLVVGLCVLVGAGALRFCMVELSLFDPSQAYAASQYVATTAFNG